MMPAINQTKIRRSHLLSDDGISSLLAHMSELRKLAQPGQNIVSLASLRNGELALEIRHPALCRPAPPNLQPKTEAMCISGSVNRTFASRRVRVSLMGQ